MNDVLNQMQVSIFVTDPDTDEILFMNEKMKKDYQISEPEGKKCWEVLQVGEKGRCKFCRIPELFEKTKKNDVIKWREDNLKLGKTFENFDSVILWNGKPAHMQQSYDITGMLQLTESAVRDSLCDVWNRANGKKLLEERIEKLTGTQSCVLMILDITKLGHINEFFGLSEGDYVLKEISSYLNSQIEKPDFMFRLSGDEFVMVFFDKSVKDISRKALEWRTKIEKFGENNDKPYAVSFSHGISYTSGTKKCTADELLDQADERMYEEKLRKRKNESLARREEISLNTRDREKKMEYPSEYLYEALVQSTDDYVYICNMKTGIFQYTPAQVKAFDLPGEVVSSPLIYWKNIVHPDDWDRFYKSNMEIGENKRDAHYVEFRAKQRNGEYVWLRCRGHLIRDEYGNPALFGGIMHRMGGQNKIDPLTQLFNYHVFTRRISQGIENTEMERMAVVILDIDNFRQFNEMYGRKKGDRILCTMAHCIQALLPENAGIFRMDNDRMGILMANAGVADVQMLFADIRKNLWKIKEWKSYKMEVHFSAGCSVYPDDGETVDELCQYADYALQHAKEQGKNRLVIFTEEILQRKNYTLELIRKLRSAVNQKFRGFYVNYQPQVSGRTGEIIGAEALARFRDGEGNMISPAEFVPVMEAEGMIYGMGLWILRKSIQAAKKWIALKLDFSISINASALQLMEDSYIPDVIRILKEEAFPPENLVIELTESNTVQNLDIFRDKYELLRKMGIRVAMDDFGTGYSSLEFLKKAPIDFVKIDRSFVKDILSSRFDSTFINFIVAICHDVNIKVCQEGVETEEEYLLLKEMDLDCIQGYYFGAPVEENVITEKLKA